MGILTNNLLNAQVEAFLQNIFSQFIESMVFKRF